MHKLLIKTHNKTGLKYLCYTKKIDHEKYAGSGIEWKNHLKKNGYYFSTELIFQSNNYDDFKKVAIKKSIEYNVVDSDEWANLKLEEGDGGDTVSNKKWITNDKTDIYVLKDSILPEGWYYGRSNCIFNDSKKQSEFSLKANFQERGKKIKKAWEEGRVKRDNSKCGTKGEKNVAKREDVKEKIRNYQLNRPSKYCDVCNKWFKNFEVHIKRSEKHNGK